MVSGLAEHPQMAGHLGGANILLKEGARLQAAFFHGSVIAGLILHATQ
jgi:hypothetical protein